MLPSLNFALAFTVTTLLAFVPWTHRYGDDVHVVGAFAKEVLPPEAYINRTIFPELVDYSTSKRGYPNLAIGLLSDIQYANKEEVGRRHFKLSMGKLQHAVNEFNVNRTHLDLVMHLGDLVDSDMAVNLPKLQPILDQLKAPLYQVLGNHDFLGSPETAFDSIHKALKMPSRYYSLNAGRQDRYRLVVLDGNDLALYSTRTGSAERKEAEAILAGLRRRKARNAKGFNGAVGAKQMEWLKRELAGACEAQQTALVFIHHPMRPRDEPTNLWNDIAMVPIITSFPCVAAVINGHAHKFLYDYHHTKHRDVHFVTFGGMVQSPFTSFGFADVYDDQLHIHGLIFGREVDHHYDIRRSEGSGTAAMVPAGSIVKVSSGVTEGPTRPTVASTASDQAVPTGYVSFPTRGLSSTAASDGDQGIVSALPGATRIAWWLSAVAVGGVVMVLMQRTRRLRASR